ncbi:lipoprotein [Kosakonia radicincitans]
MKKPVILLFLSVLLAGCSGTQTVYVPAPSVPLPPGLTQPVIAPLPPAR